MLELRKATIDDTDAVLAFYHHAIDEMAGTDFDIMWKHDEHPSNVSIQEAIAAGGCYIGIAEDGRIACGAVVNHDQADGYEKVDWQVQAPIEEVGIVHSVYTLAEYHGSGFATQLMQFVVDSSREEGLRALRLDTLVHNHRAHGLYGKVGFLNHGTYSIEYDEYGTLELDMFEYVLEQNQGKN